MSAHDIASILLEIRAVTLNVKEPYRYTSGILSPIYCDNRLVISHPDKRQKIIEAFLSVIAEQKLEFGVVGGTATAGIPHAAWISDRLNKPMIYIRGEAKGHGKKNQIEGVLTEGDRVLVVEDLVSTGGSSVAAAEAVRSAGGIVTDCVAIFTYGMEKSKKLFADADIALHTLTSLASLVEVAEQNEVLTTKEVESVLAWSRDPQGWGKTMGYE